MGNFAAALTGLANGLNTYLGNQQKTENEMAINKQKSDLELDQFKKLLNYKQEIEGDISPEMGQQLFSSISPEFGKAAFDSLTMFKQQNGRNMTMDEANKALDPVMKALQAKKDKASEEEEQHQDKLEKEYADRRFRVMSNRSGGLGLQDQKVNQAIDLRKAIEQFYDPKTDKYKIPPTVHAEMIVGLDRLLSQGGQLSQQREEQIKQDTLREGVSRTLIKWGLANPEEIGGPTQDVSRLLVHMIDRQGEIAETLRDTYENGIKQLAPSRLSKERKENVDKAQLTNSFRKTLAESPDRKKHMEPHLQKHPVGKVMVMNKDGQKGYIPVEQLDQALQAGFKQVEK